MNHAQVCIISLPSGAVKTVSTGTLEALSREADPPLAKVQLAQHAVLEAANKAENQINHMKKNVQSFFELTQPFNKVYQACVVDGRLGLFQGDQFFVSTAGEDTQAQGPHPIKNYWGSDNQEMQLDGLFDAVTLYADRLYIRKGELYWDQPVGGIKALNERRSD